MNRCGYTGYFKCVCPECTRLEVRDDGALDTLAANLAIGAALCRAERLGYRRGINDTAHFMRDDKIDAWRSGCNKEAP